MLLKVSVNLLFKSGMPIPRKRFEWEWGGEWIVDIITTDITKQKANNWFRWPKNKYIQNKFNYKN